MQLRSLLTQAKAKIKENYPDASAKDILSPITSLLDSPTFWQHLSDGLVILAGEGFPRSFRLDVDFVPEVTVGNAPHFNHVLTTVANNTEFILLAISLNRVRLFSRDRFTITDLPLGDIPASSTDLDGFYTREPQFQHQSAPTRAGAAHGHGPREDITKEGFLQTVGKKLQERFANAKEPLVIASVNEYGAALVAEMPALEVLGKTVAGNPDQLSPVQLHQAAWPVVAKESAYRHHDNMERFGNAMGAGTARSDSAEIEESASIARIGTLLLTPEFLEQPSAAVDQAIADTLRFGGEVDIVAELKDGAGWGAIYRF